MEDLKTFLEGQGYLFLKEIPGRGWCGLERMIFTWGLFYGLDWGGRTGRYCFEDFSEAVSSLLDWDGVGDPPGDWIKHFGEGGEYSNPTKNENDPQNNA